MIQPAFGSRETALMQCHLRFTATEFMHISAVDLRSARTSLHFDLEPSPSFEPQRVAYLL